MSHNVQPPAILHIEQLDLSQVGNVPVSYQHHQRIVQSGPLLKVPQGYLKWYEVYRSGADIPPNLWREARQFVLVEARQNRISLSYGLGHIVVHLSWPIVFLIAGHWQGHQEMWTRHYTRDLQHDAGFELDCSQGTRPFCCVWEMAPIWHERDAWVRFLYSARDDAAKREFLTDQLNGEI